MNFVLLIVISIIIVVGLIVWDSRRDTFGNVIKNSNTILDKFDAYYINLKRRPDKNKNTLIELEKSNLLKTKMKRFEAIDGKEIDLNNYLEPGISSKLLEKRRGWIGCALSHIELWNRCISIKKPILIFEDDNVIKEELNYDKHLEIIINNFPTDFDMVYLVTDNIVKYKPYNDLFVKAKSDNSILSAYFISPSGAQKLLDSIMPYKPYLQIDWYINRLTNNNKINCYIYRKSIMYTIQDFNTTDIQGKTNYVKKFEKNY
jgi:GR25 family glycosyltransferase involved in LPS biosynthesis